MSSPLKNRRTPIHWLRFVTTAALFFLLYAVCYPPGAAADIQSPPEKTILVLHSFKARQPWVLLFDRYLMAQLRDQISFPYTIEIENLDLLDFNEPQFKDILMQQLKYKYSKHPPDILVATFEPAIKLVLENEFFRNIPKILILPSESNLTENPRAVVIPFAYDFKGSVANILMLLPDTRDIYVVAGNASIDVNTVSMFARETKGVADQITVHYFDGLRTEEVLERLGRLPAGSVVFYLSYSLDTEGRTVVAKDFCETVGLRSNRPVFTYLDFFALDTGILGGRVTTTNASAATAANAIERLFQGQPIESIKIEPSGFEYIYDWREIQKWGINGAKLPAGSIIQNRTYTFFEVFKWQIIGGISVILGLAMLSFFLARALKLRNAAVDELAAERKNLARTVEERTRELVQSNRNLTESEERFRNLSDAAFEGIVFTENGVIVDANMAAQEIFGYSASEFANRPAIDFIGLDEREKTQNLMDSGYSQPYETKGLKKDGTVFPMQVHGKTFSHKGRMIRVTAMRDLTELKKSEEEIKVLRGILPICASCKKIRDDQGYWNRIEMYIHDHSEAEFSHGICPECIGKLYPDFKKNDSKLDLE